MKQTIITLFLIAMCTGCFRKSDMTNDQREYEWTSQLTRRTGELIVKGMLIDTSAVSSDPSKPAFMAPPPGSKAYHGFPLVDDIVIEGFKFGTITDYLQNDSPAGCTIGDAFVEAPDGTRAGLVWEFGDERMFSRIRSPDINRWGVYYFSVPYVVKTKEDMRKNFAEMVPKLKELHQKPRSQ